MYTVTKNICFHSYVQCFLRKKLSKQLFILLLFSSFFMFQEHCYAMEQPDDLEERQNIKQTFAQHSEDRLNISSEEDATSLLPTTNPQSWKQNWFVKNIVVEFPIVGDFFHDDPSVLDSIKRAGKTTSMLVGGSVGMMLHFIPMSEKDDMAAKAAKSSFNMAIGMWIATSTYNTVLSLGAICYNYAKGEKSL